MELRGIKEADLNGKKVLVRVDFNVPLNGSEITDTTRIDAALPTLRYLLDASAAVILMSHIGRPKGKVTPELSTKLLVPYLEKQLSGVTIKWVSDCVGSEAESAAASLKPGEILLLENLRFHKEETDNDEAFAKQLSSLAQIYVNDAFGSAHRAHASVVGVTKNLPSYAGLLLEKEVGFFAHLLENPEKPFLSIVGGAKVSSKLSVLYSLLERSTHIAVGGGMTYTFLEALGHNVGTSLVEKDLEKTALEFLDAAKKKGVEVLIPVDAYSAPKFDSEAKATYVDGTDTDAMMLDIGPKSVERIGEVVSKAKVIFWNGPMGVFEFPAFRTGTEKVARLLAASSALTVVGGGDSVAAVNMFNLFDKFNHVSTGGGASLEFLEGKTLPGVAALLKK